MLIKIHIVFTVFFFLIYKLQNATINQIHFNTLFEGGLIYWGGGRIIFGCIFVWLQVDGPIMAAGGGGEGRGVGVGVWLISSSLWHSF